MNVGEVLVRFAAEISGFTDGIRKMVEQASSFGSQMQSVAGRTSDAFGSMGSSIISHVGNMAWGVGKGIVSIGSSLLGAIEGFGRFVFFAQFAAQAAMGFAQALLGQNANMEQSRVAFAGLLGSGQAADAMLRQLWNFAATTPFEFPELVQSTQQLLGMGFAARDVIPVLTAVGDAAAGVGRGKEGVDRITLALGQMQARGKVTGQDMMQLTEAGIPAWKILAESMHLTVAQVEDLSQQGKLGADSVTALWHGMEHMYGGQMASQAKTFNGLLSTLHDNAMAALMTFSGPLFDMAKTALGGLVNLVSSPAFASFAKTMGEKVAGAIQFLVQWTTTKLVPALQSLWTWVQGNVIPALQSLAQFIQEKVVPMVQSLWNWTTTKLVPALQSLAQWIQDKVIGAFSALYTFIQNKVMPVLSAVWTFIQNKLVPVLQGWWNKINDVIGAIDKWNTQNDALHKAIHFVYLEAWQLWNILTSQLKPTFDTIRDTINNQILPAFKGLSEALKPLQPLLRTLGQNLWIVAIPLALVAADALLLLSALGGLVAGLGTIVRGIAVFVGGIVQLFSGLVMQVSGYLQALDDLIHGKFDKIGKDMKLESDGFKLTWSGAWNIIQAIWMLGMGGIIAIAQAFVETVAQIFMNLYNTLVGHSIVPDMVNGIVGWFAQLPSRALGAVSPLSGDLAGFFNNLAGQAFQWGANIVQSVASGLMSRIGSAIGAASAVAGAIANFLPHSPAKEGPLSHLDEFGPALTGGVAAGIMRGLPTVHAAVSMMVSPLQGNVGVATAAAPLTMAQSRERGGSASETNDLLRQILRQLGHERGVTKGQIIDALGDTIASSVRVHYGGQR